MGCDIHGWIERKVGDKWIGVHPLPDKASWRNYNRFASLAGVRGEGPEARGIPDDISDSAKLSIDYWSVDGHSHSWLPLGEAATIFRDTEWNATDVAMERPDVYFFDVEADQGEHRIVFWFDS